MIPTHKQKKYDRQLRLWKEHGQTALEKTSVCLLNATALGAEILKNLILPSIGHFTIIDNGAVSEEDLGRNFFLTSVGKHKAEEMALLLKELNEDVSCDFLLEDPETIDVKTLQKFNVIIACSLSDTSLLKLSDYCHENKKILLICHTNGFFGYFRVYSPEICIIETHQENTVDLRLDCPWEELEDFCDQFDLKKMDSMELSHTPYVVLLIKILKEFKQKHGRAPFFKDKEDMKRLLLSYGSADEENFHEALSQLFRALSETKVPSSVKLLFEDESCSTLTYKSDPFWFLVRALKDFVDDYGVLPLMGSLPDMKSDTSRYIDLQRVYKGKYEKDKKAFNQYLLKITEAHGVNSINEDVVDRFCKSAQLIKVFRFRTLREEYENPKCSLINSEIECQSEIEWYIVYRAVQKYKEVYKKHPGEIDVESPVGSLKKFVTALIQELNVTNSIPDEVIHEMCRFGGSELHNIASFMGGIAAQECIKLVTKQYIPVDNTVIFNGMTSTSKSFSL